MIIIRNFIIFFGAIDMSLILTFCYSVIVTNKGGLSEYASDHIGMIFSFESFYFFVISILGGVLFFSVFVSGILMIFLFRVGVFLSLVQAPFRFALIIPPSFFFIQNIPFLSASLVVSAVMIGVLELSKVIIQIVWLKKTKTKPNV